MFQPTAAEGSAARVWARSASALLHLIALGALLRVPEPDILKVNPVMKGDGGTSVEIVYSGRDRGGAERAAFEPRRLNPPPPAPQKKVEAPQPARHPDAVAAESSGTPARAGSPTGSALFGDMRGRDVRPAIPTLWADPEIYPWQVANLEGRVVVEITIDAQGQVTAAKVIESLHRSVDEKVLEAAWKWRFRPATVDGVPIASRQDLVFRFPS